MIFDKRLLALVLIAYVTLLIGCSGGNGGVNLKVDDDYRSGTDSVRLSFNSATTSKMFEGESGVVVLSAKNAGAHTIEYGQLVLSSDDSVVYFGSKDGYLSSSAPKNSVPLVKSSSRRPFFGKSAISPYGDELTYDFPLYAINLPQESQQRSAKIVAIACFEYGTFQSDLVCIDTDQYNIKTSAQVKSVCDSKDISPKTGGGPVNVQKIETRMNKVGTDEILPSFYFTLSASTGAFGATKIFTPGAEQKFCNSNIASGANEANKVFFKATLSDLPLNCEAELVSGLRDTYLVTLYDNAARVFCTAANSIFTYDIGGNYKAPITMNISYGAVVTASQTIQVNALS